MDKNMTDLVIAIPLTLTASQIIRGSPKAISDPEALELHDLIGEVQARFVYVKRPLVGGGFFETGEPPSRLPTLSTRCGAPFSGFGLTTVWRRRANGWRFV